MLALHGDPAPLRRAVTHAAEALGTQVDVAITEDPDDISNRMPVRHHVMVLGRPLRAGAVGEMARRISDLGGNIHSIVRLTHRPVTALELVVSGSTRPGSPADWYRAPPPPGSTRRSERAGLQRRAKRLLLLDLDTVLVGPSRSRRWPTTSAAGRVPRAAGRGRGRRQVGRGRGPGPGRAAGRRARRLPGRAAGPDAVDARRPRADRRRPPGRAPRRVVTSGIAQVGERLVDGLQLDFLAANRLETADGRLTGRIVGEVVGGGGRGRALVRFAGSYGVPLTQSVAVGCGAEAAELVRLAGLGVVLDAARPSDGEPQRSAHLDALQFVLGLRTDDPDEPVQPEEILAASRRGR